MQAVILMGGEGRRLFPLTENCPKPLLQVSGRPFIEFMLKKLVEQGFDDFLFLCGYRSSVFLNYTKTSSFFLKNIKKFKVSIDEELLGTGGAIKNAEPMLKDDFLLINGDSYLDMDYKNFCTPIGALKIAVVRCDDCTRYGEVRVNNENIVTGMGEKEKIAQPGLINAGVYFLRRNIFTGLKSKENLSLERDVIPKLIQENKLIAENVNGFFIDIGVPDDFKKANKIFFENS